MTIDQHTKHFVSTTPRRTGIDNKRAEQAEIALLTKDFMANGGQITELPSEHVRSNYNPAWHDLKTVDF